MREKEENQKRKSQNQLQFLFGKKILFKRHLFISADNKLRINRCTVYIRLLLTKNFYLIMQNEYQKYKLAFCMR